MGADAGRRDRVLCAASIGLRADARRREEIVAPHEHAPDGVGTLHFRRFGVEGSGGTFVVAELADGGNPGSKPWQSIVISPPATAIEGLTALIDNSCDFIKEKVR